METKKKIAKWAYIEVRYRNASIRTRKHEARKQKQKAKWAAIRKSDHNARKQIGFIKAQTKAQFTGFNGDSFVLQTMVYIFLI